jgi:hypothetical protein
VISVSKKLRTAYYQALNGNVEYDSNDVPVVDGFMLSETISSHHIIIADVNETASNTTDTFRTEAVITLQIVSRVDGYTKDIVDDIEDQVLNILMPSPTSGSPLTVSGIEVNNIIREGSTYLEEYSQNGAIIRKILMISQTITEQ